MLQQHHAVLAHTGDSTNRLIDQGMVPDVIAPEERCISPSDFGLHNAIRTAADIRFIDFEFAGWDDPAKALVNFIFSLVFQFQESHQHYLQPCIPFREIM